MQREELQGGIQVAREAGVAKARRVRRLHRTQPALVRQQARSQRRGEAGSDSLRRSRIEHASRLDARGPQAQVHQPL